MLEHNVARLRELVRRAVGPAPWYWQTFPPLSGTSGQRFAWTHHGNDGPLGYLVSLAVEHEPDKPILALNTYCRPFLMGNELMGIWCPEGKSLRFVCFDPAAMKNFDLAEVAGWFKQSTDRIYAATTPVAEFEIRLSLASGSHQIDVPTEFESVKETIVPTSCKAMSKDDPAFALFVVSPHARRVEVLPQRWFTTSQYEVGRQWIPRAARDSETGRIVGECFGVGSFLLEEDGCRLERWLERM